MGRGEESNSSDCSWPVFARRPPIEYVKSFYYDAGVFCIILLITNFSLFSAVMMLFDRFLSEFYVDCIHLQSTNNGDWDGTKTHILKRTVSPNTARD